MTRPISPGDIATDSRLSGRFPDEVVEVWNRLLARNYRETSGGRGWSEVFQDEAAAELTPLLPEGLTLEQSGWLNIEPMYRSKGWRVQYSGDTWRRCVYKFEGSSHKWFEE